MDKFNLIDTINLAKRSAKRIIEKIKNNEYEIAPSGKDISKPLKLDSLKCTYCSHRDICYVNPIEDARDYTKFIRDEISGKGGNDNE